MALIDRVPGDLALYIGGYVMLSTRTLSPLMADAVQPLPEPLAIQLADWTMPELL
jgi:uncharacterized membrane protein